MLKGSKSWMTKYGRDQRATWLMLKWSKAAWLNIEGIKELHD